MVEEDGEPACTRDHDFALESATNPMISDDQLNNIALTFGFASIVLILVYHAISTNITAYRN